MSSNPSYGADTVYRIRVRGCEYRNSVGPLHVSEALDAPTRRTDGPTAVGESAVRLVLFLERG
jgi:hypothetical protein